MAILGETLDSVSSHVCTEINFVFQPIPAPEFSFADYHYKQEICFTNAPKNDPSIKKIGSWINGLMNTSGGWIILYCPKPVSFKAVDAWVMGFEKILREQWISDSIYTNVILPFKRWENTNQFRIYIYICKSPGLTTFNFKAFERLETHIKPIKDTERIVKMLSEEHGSYHPSCISAFADKGSTFQFKESLSAPWFESRKLEHLNLRF